jgi:hypothetical protein
MSGFLGAMLEYWGNLALQANTRANAARTKIDAGTYGPTELLSDSLSLSIAAVEGWWDAALKPGAAAVPLAFLKLRVGDAAAGPVTVTVKSTPAAPPPAPPTPPTATNLTSADGNTTIPLGANLVVRFKQVGGVDDRSQLEVSLRNLIPLAPPAGVYEGIAYIDQTPLAAIIAVIT